MRGVGVGDLHRRFAIEICVVGKHAAKHGNIRGSVDLRQNGVGLRVDRLPGQHLVRQSECGLAFVGRDEGKLADIGRIVGLLVFELAEHLGNLPCGRERRFFVHAFFDEMLKNVEPQPLSAASQVALEFRFEHVRGADSALQRL